MTTDELWDALPMRVYDNDDYFLDVFKGSKRVIVQYKTNRDEAGFYKCLRNTYRGGTTLNEALQSMYDWLLKFDYIFERPNILKSTNLKIPVPPPDRVLKEGTDPKPPRNYDKGRN
jgi:hypothetical protein